MQTTTVEVLDATDELELANESACFVGEFYEDTIDLDEIVAPIDEAEIASKSMFSIIEGHRNVAMEEVAEVIMQHRMKLGRYATMILRNETEAFDLVDDLYVRLAKRLEWGPLHVDSLTGYLQSMVSNGSVDKMRHRAVVEKTNDVYREHMENSTEVTAISNEQRRRVRAALQALPDRQRQALVLRYWGDLGEADIANEMGISRGAVKSHTARGRDALREAFESLRAFL